MDGKKRRLIQFRVATVLGSSLIAALVAAVLWPPLTTVSAMLAVPRRPIRGIIPESPPPETCLICGAPVVRIDQITDDLAKPSRNIAVWNRSSCGNPLFGPGSVICVNDWYAHSARFKQWSLSLNDPAGFAIELDQRIRDLSLPEGSTIGSAVVYSQQINEQVEIHSVSLWCDTDENYLKQLEAKAIQSGLTVRIVRERLPGESTVLVEATNQRNAVTAQ